MEYIFLQIQEKSVGDSQISKACPDDKKTQVEFEVDLSTIQVQMSEDHDGNSLMTLDYY